MEAANNFICLTIILTLSGMSAQDVQEPTPIITTENYDFSAFETTLKPPDDNGMVIPEEYKPNPPTAVEGKEEEPHAVEEQPVVVSFPENHKNFTPSQYLEEYPPYYNHLSSYQQQYKNYNEQKEIYNRKPIKFEENSLKNYYLPPIPDPTDVGDEKRNENFRVHRNPFPYAFENERGQEHNSNWHKNPGHVLVHEQPANEHVFRGHQEQPVNDHVFRGHQEQQANDHVFRGHQEQIVPYYVYPHGYPHEEKFHKDELHYSHHHVKEHKGSPWKKVFHVLTALVPLGLLLATLTPNVISINSTSTAKTTRKRSEDPSPFQFKEEDVLRLMKKYGVESLTEMQCEDRVICELAREGGRSTAGPIEKGFWFLANQTPWDVAEKAGMNDLFKAIKTGNCETYKCHSKKKSSNFGKKLIRKHKNPE